MMTFLMRYSTLARCAALGLALVILAPVAHAQGQVEVPESCTAVLTAHKTGCVVTTLVQCEGGGWQSLSYRCGSLHNTLHYTPQWDFAMWETEGAGAMRFTALPGTGSVVDLATLTETGVHAASGDFLMNTNIIRNQQYTLSGETKATGEVLTIGAENFDVYLAERAFARNGTTQVLNFSTELLVSQSRDVLLEGNFGRGVNGGKKEHFDLRPQKIYGPGEPGFLVTASEVDCE